MKISIVLMLCILIIYLLTRPLKSFNMFGKKVRKEGIFLFLSCTLLFFVAALRGDFSTDYPIYYLQFGYYRDMPWSNIIHVRDIGFFLWSKIIFLFTDNVLFGFISMALVMMLMYHKYVKDESANFLLSMILLVGVDNYIVSFNLMRYILVVSIYINLTKYIAAKDLKKYLLGVVLLSTVHRAAIIAIPFYWLLSIDYRKRKNAIILMAGTMFFCVMLFFTREIADLVQKIIGMKYNTDSGMNYGTIGSFLKTGLLLLFIVFYRRKFDYNNIKERMWFNGCGFAMIFHLLAANVYMLHRPAYLFSGFYILLIPLIISRMPKNKRKMINIGFIVTTLLYCQLFQTVSDYYPFWQNVLVHY